MYCTSLYYCGVLPLFNIWDAGTTGLDGRRLKFKGVESILNPSKGRLKNQNFILSSTGSFMLSQSSATEDLKHLGLELQIVWGLKWNWKQE